MIVLNTTVTFEIPLVGAGALGTFLSSQETSGPTLIFTDLGNIKVWSKVPNRRPTGLISTLRDFLFSQLNVFVWHLNAFYPVLLNWDSFALPSHLDIG